MLNKFDCFFYWIIRLLDECNVGDVIYWDFSKIFDIVFYEF